MTPARLDILARLPLDRLNLTTIFGFLALSGVAVFLGMFIAVLGNSLGIYALYYLVAACLALAAGLFVVLSPSPERRIFFALLLGLPLIAAIFPPRRFGISVFDAMMLTTLALQLGRYITEKRFATGAFFISWHFRTAFIGLFFLVGFSYFPAHSLWIWFETLAIYVFFRCCVDEMQDEKGFERIIFWLGIVVIALFAGVLIDRFAHINLTLGGGNPNQYLLLKGDLIRRAGGFFQDPQKSAQFFSCAGALFFALLICNRLPSGPAKKAALIALPLCLGGIVLSGSRLSLIAIVLALGWGSIFLTRTSSATRLLIVLVLAACGTIFLMLPTDAWLALLPPQIIARFETLGESLDFRMHIWFDTWKMFADQPLWGIGPGSFREYLRTTNPTSLGFYGLGSLNGAEYVPDQPESGYLKILYEGGIVGSLCALIIVIGTLRKAAAEIFSPISSVDRKSEAVAGLLGLAVFGITFVSLFTLSDEKNVAILCLMLAIIWRKSDAGATQPITGKLNRDGHAPQPC